MAFTVHTTVITTTIAVTFWFNGPLLGRLPVKISQRGTFVDSGARPSYLRDAVSLTHPAALRTD